MIEKEQFIKLIQGYKDYISYIENVDDLLNTNIFESKIVDYSFRLFDLVIEISFNEEGSDIIFWWLYEKSTNPELKIFDKTEELPTETTEDIWNIVKEYRK